MVCGIDKMFEINMKLVFLKSAKIPSLPPKANSLQEGSKFKPLESSKYKVANNFTKYPMCYIFWESSCNIQFNGHDKIVACDM